MQLFLIASGFGLTWSLLRHADTKPDWRGYYIRRFWRIYPMWWVAHFVMLALGIIGAHGFAVDPTRPGVWASALGLRVGGQQMYVFAASWWFVGMIIQFYAVFPVFYWIFKRLGWQRFLAILVPVGIIVRALGLWAFDAPLAGMHYLDAWAHGAIFLSRLPEFVLGMALAGAMRQDPIRVQRLLSARWLLVGAVVMYLPALGLSLMVVGNAVSSVLVALCNLILVRAMAVAAERWLPSLASAMRWCAVHSLSLCLVNSVAINLMIRRGTLPDLPQLLRSRSGDHRGGVGLGVAHPDRHAAGDKPYPVCAQVAFVRPLTGGRPRGPQARCGTSRTSARPARSAAGSARDLGTRIGVPAGRRRGRKHTARGEIRGQLRRRAVVDRRHAGRFAAGDVDRHVVDEETSPGLQPVAIEQDAIDRPVRLADALIAGDDDAVEQLQEGEALDHAREGPAEKLVTE